MSKLTENSQKMVSREKKEEIKRVKTREKRLVKTILLWVIAFVAVGCAIIYIPSLFADESGVYEQISVTQIDEVYPTINPYPADFDKDLSTHDPIIMYEYPDGNAYAIRDIPKDVQNEAHRFFIEYFDVLKTGNSEKYAALFTKSYKKDPKGFEKDFTRVFPPQKLFDIKVTELLRSTDTTVDYNYEGKKCFFGYYLVSYKIDKNDGMFRRDLYSREIERPLVFELVTFDKDTENEVTLIKNLYTQSSIAKN